jgi:hypothetical protein
VKTTLGVAVLGAALVLGTGCGAAADKAAERVSEEAAEEAIGGGNVDIDDDGNVQVETEDGSVAYGTGDLPEGWPEDVPMPDETEIEGSFGGTTASGTNLTVAGETSLSPEEVDQHFAGIGWTTDSEFSGGAADEDAGYVRSLSDGERTLAITAAAGTDGKTTFSATYMTP